MGEFFDIRDYSDEDQRLLGEIAAGLGKSIDDAAEEIIGLIMRNRKAIEQRITVAAVADMAEYRAKKRYEKGPQAS